VLPEYGHATNGARRSWGNGVSRRQPRERARISGEEADYASFERVLQETLAKNPMRVHKRTTVSPSCGAKRAAMLYPGPLPRGKDWLDWVNRPQGEADLVALQNCLERGTPCGNETWQHATAKRLGLEASLHPRGRPRIHDEK
jgi:hypothetical protein